jgi:hypothetical protein
LVPFEFEFEFACRCRTFSLVQFSTVRNAMPDMFSISSVFYQRVGCNCRTGSCYENHSVSYEQVLPLKWFGGSIGDCNRDGHSFDLHGAAPASVGVGAGAGAGTSASASARVPPNTVAMTVRGIGNKANAYSATMTADGHDIVHDSARDTSRDIAPANGAEADTYWGTCSNSCSSSCCTCISGCVQLADPGYPGYPGYSNYECREYCNYRHSCGAGCALQSGADSDC